MISHSALVPRLCRSVAILAVILGGGVAHAQSTTPPQPGTQNQQLEGMFDDNRVRTDDDGEFRVAGRLVFEGQHLGNFDLDRSIDDDQLRALPEARIELTWEPGDDIETFVSFEGGMDIDHRENGGTDVRARLELREAFVLFDDVLVDEGELQIGRQDFEDGREWLFDERLDGLRLGYDKDRIDVWVAVVRLGLVRRDLLRRDHEPDIDNFIVHGEYKLTDRWDVAAYVMAQKHEGPEDLQPRFIGVQSEGRLGRSFGHWLELSLQRGRVGGRKLRGNAVDAGLIYYPSLPAQPALFAGYARGSGGESSDVDRNFRQTGLQDNEDRITGIANARYYGELLDPELSNLQIFTLGAGVRPSARSSVELIFHKYRQVQVSDDEIRNSPVEVEPEGESPDLGFEIDLVGAIRLGERVGLEGKLGYFRPGSAFDNEEDDPAIFGKTRLVYRF